MSSFADWAQGTIMVLVEVLMHTVACAHVCECKSFMGIIQLVITDCVYMLIGFLESATM